MFLSVSLRLASRLHQRHVGKFLSAPSGSLNIPRAARSLPLKLSTGLHTQTSEADNNEVPYPTIPRKRRRRLPVPEPAPDVNLADQLPILEVSSPPMPLPSDQQGLPPRNLVLCFDGTSNEFEADKVRGELTDPIEPLLIFTYDQNTNIVHLFQMLKRDKPDKQLVYYQTGVGTLTPRTSILGKRISESLDQAFAWYLEEHVVRRTTVLRSGTRVLTVSTARRLSIHHGNLSAR